MSTRFLAAAVALAALFAPARVSALCGRATSISAEITASLSTTQSKVTAPGYIELRDDAGRLCNYGMTTTLKIIQDSPRLEFVQVSSAPSGSLLSIEGPAQAGACYTASIDARGEGLRDVHHDGPACWFGPPECDTCARDTCEVSPWECNYTPIVLRLAGGGYDLTGIEDPVSFDIDADGKPELIGWIERDSRQGLLAIDRNRNSVIDDGSELFGNRTSLPGGTVSANGFEVLAHMDSNGDGVVDPNDEEWSKLLLWTDANHDGVSDPSELIHLDTVAIRWLAYDYWTTNRRDPSGNVFRYQSQFGIGRATRSYYDIYLVGRP